jgi:hypothetical protein
VEWILVLPISFLYPTYSEDSGVFLAVVFLSVVLLASSVVCVVVIAEMSQFVNPMR